MRIRRLEAKNFIGIKGELDLEFDKPVSVLVGPNYAGKTSVIDAIRTLVTGTCRGLRKGDRAEMTHEGARGFRLAGEIESGKEMTRVKRTVSQLERLVVDQETGVEDAVQWTETKLRKFLNADDDALAATFDIGHLLSMAPKERIALALRVTGTKADPEWLAEQGLKDEDACELAAAGDWKKALAHVTEAKRRANRHAQNLESEPPPDPEIEFKEGVTKRASEIPAAKIAEFRGFEAKLDEQVAALEAELRGARGGDEEALSAARAELEAVQKRLEELDHEGTLTKLKEKRAELSDAEERLENSQNRLAELKREIAGVKDILQSKQDALRSYEKAADLGEHTCPICQNACTGAIDSSTVAELRGEIAELVESIEPLQEREIKAQTAVASDRDEVGSWRTEITNLEKRLTSIELAREEEDRAERRVGRLKEAAAKAGKIDVKGAEERLEMARQKRQRVQSVIRALTEYREALGAHRDNELEAEALRSRAKGYEGMEALCKPDGLPKLVLGPVLTDLRDAVQEWGKMLPFTVSITDDFEIVPMGRPLAFLSGAERWVLGLVVSGALAKISGLGFLCVDEAAVLDFDNRKKLPSVLRQIAEDLDQIIVAMPQGEKAPKQAPESWPMRIYVVEPGGKVRAP